MDCAPKHPLDRTHNRSLHEHLWYLLHRSVGLSVHSKYLPTLRCQHLRREQYVEELAGCRCHLVLKTHVHWHWYRRRCEFVGWLHGDMQFSHVCSVEVG
jgi:hypothetical protein